EQTLRRSSGEELSAVDLQTSSETLSPNPEANDAPRSEIERTSPVQCVLNHCAGFGDIKKARKIPKRRFCPFDHLIAQDTLEPNFFRRRKSKFVVTIENFVRDTSSHCLP